MNSEIGVIINYCSNEEIFLDNVLRETSKFSDNIIVSYGNKLYDGTIENMQHIQYYHLKYPLVKFVEYNVDLNQTNLKGVKNRPIAYYHNLARWTAIKKLNHTTEWVLIIDADEIPEGNKFLEWRKNKNLNINTAYKLANYWYFKSPNFQSKTLEDSVLLINKIHLTEENIFNDYERDDIIKQSGVSLERMNLYNNKPMFHHFSFVRGKKGLHTKLSTWAHRHELFDKSVTVDDIINYIYKDDNPNDIIHRYEYINVENIFNITIS